MYSGSLTEYNAEDEDYDAMSYKITNLDSYAESSSNATARIAISKVDPIEESLQY